jgi:hypothetical protein
VKANHLIIGVGKKEASMPLKAGSKGMLTRERLLEQKAALKAVYDLEVEVKIASSTKPGKMEKFRTEDVCADTGAPYQFQCQRLTVLDCFSDGGVDMPPMHSALLTASLVKKVMGGVVAAVKPIVDGMSTPVNGGTAAFVATTAVDGKIAAHLKKIGGVPGNDVENRKAMARALADAAIPGKIEATAAALAGGAATNENRRTAIASTALDGAFSTGLACGATATQAQKTTGFNNFLSVAPGSAMAGALGTITDANFAGKRTAAIAVTAGGYNQTDAGYPAVLEAFVAQMATSWGSSDAAYACGRATAIGGMAASFADAAAFAGAKKQITDAISLGGRAIGLATMGLDAKLAGGLKLAAAGARAAGANKVTHDVIASVATALPATKALVLAKILLPTQIAGISKAAGGGDAGKAFALASLTTDGAIDAATASTSFGANVVTASAQAANTVTITVNADLTTKLVKGQKVMAGTCSGTVDSITATTVVLSSTSGTCTDHSTAGGLPLKTDSAACGYVSTVDEKVLAFKAFLTSSSGSVMAPAVGGVGSITAATFATKRMVAIQTTVTAQGWATNPTKAAAYEKSFIETTIAGKWGASASAYTCAMANGVASTATVFGASEGTYMTNVQTTATSTYATMWYGPRPALATATPDQILDAVSGTCKMWDDPAAPIMPVLYKELTVGGTAWEPAKSKTTDAKGYEVPGWAAPGKDVWSQQQPYTTSAVGWARTGDAYAKLISARSLEQVHRTIGPNALKNRLVGLNPSGTPLKATNPTSGTTVIGRAVPTAFSKRGATLDITYQEAKDILLAWEVKFADEAYKGLAAHTHSDTYFYGESSLSRMLRDTGGAQTTLLILGTVLMLLYTFGVLYATAGFGWGVTGVVCAVFAIFAVCAGFGLGSLAGVKFNPLILQVLPFLMLGMGVDDMFVVLQMAQEMLVKLNADKEEHTAQRFVALTVARAGPSITLTTATNFMVFLMIGVIKIPIVVDFSRLAAVTAITLYITNLIIVPCCAAIWYSTVSDARRNEAPKEPCACATSGVEGLLKGPKLFFALAALGITLCVGGAGFGEAVMGLNQQDVCPKGSRLEKMLETRLADYPFYPCDISTKATDFSTPAQQLKYASINERLGNLHNVLNGNPTWLLMFYRWATPDATYNAGAPAPNALCASGHTMTGGNCGPKHGCVLGMVEAGKNGVPALNTELSGAGLDFKDHSKPAGAQLFDSANPYSVCNRYTTATNPTGQASKKDWCGAMPKTAAPAGFRASDGFLAPYATKNFRQCLELWMVYDKTSSVTGPSIPAKTEPFSKCIETPGRTPACPAWSTAASTPWTKTWNYTAASDMRSYVPNFVEVGDTAKVMFSAFSFNAFRLNDNDNYLKLLKESRIITDSLGTDLNAFPSGTPFIFWEQYVTLKEDLLKWVLIELAAGERARRPSAAPCAGRVHPPSASERAHPAAGIVLIPAAGPVCSCSFSFSCSCSCSCSCSVF